MKIVLMVAIILSAVFGCKVDSDVADSENITGDSATGSVKAYYAGGSSVNTTSSAGEPLPDSLIIKPGVYLINDENYHIEQEGLFRYVKYKNSNYQRIIYSGNIDVLLSSVAWIVSHGHDDNYLSNSGLNQKALTDKLYVTCAKVSMWTKRLLQEQGFTARTVTVLTLDEWNEYDNGHNMVEIYREDMQKWVLYDIDQNAYFSDINDTPLDLIEFIEQVKINDYKIAKIANDINIDIKRSVDDFNFAFLIDRTNSDIRSWYRRVAQVAIIGNNFFDDSDVDRVVSYNSNFSYLKKSKFLDKYYP